MSTHKTLIFIPTYNEAENVATIFAQIRALPVDCDILFLDDNSPDGTGKIIDDIVKQNPKTFVIHRAGKLGIGSAHVTGIGWAYQSNYETLITMDCDFTHSPAYILEFIKNSNDGDIVVGSRYIRKDSLASWNLFRKTLTRLGHFLTVTFLKMPYDASGAFRLYRLNRIPKDIFKMIQSRGYSFFFESLFLLHFNKFKIKEISIDLPSRTYGHSKMTYADVWKSVKRLLLVYRRLVFDKKSITFKP